MAKKEDDTTLEHANEAHRDNKLANLSRQQDEQEGFGVMSRLIREVDLEQKTMPQARKELGAWFQANLGRDHEALKTEGKARARRLKQIADATFEEFSALSSQL